MKNNSPKEIHEGLSTSSLNKIKKFHYFFRYKYPKLILLIISVILAYYIFSNPLVYNSLSRLEKLGYLGVLIAGMLFSFGFTAPFSVGFFIALQPPSILFAALIGGFGAFLSDMLIFKFVKASFSAEFEKLKKEKLITKIQELINKNIGLKISNYLMYFLAGVLIASPLPDEAGITMLAGLAHIKQKVLGIISFILNSLGIFIILLLSS